MSPLGVRGLLTIMSTGFNRILLAVRDIDALRPPLLRKVAALARSSQSRLEVYHAIAEPVVLLPPRVANADANYQNVLTQASQRAQARLERAVARANLKGLRVSCRVDWDYPAFEAVVRRAATMRADLVVAVVHKHMAGARVFLRNVDWELIRHCPVPLLLLKSTRAYRRPGILVAVDPLHAADKPARLDRDLLGMAARLAAPLRGRVEMMHAWQPLALSVQAMPGMAGPLWMPQDSEDAYAKAIEKSFGRLATAAGVPPGNRHLAMGSVPDVFDKTLRKTRAQIVVMGAISRRGLSRLLIGNTAERMLDGVPSDVLVVKPRGFDSKVSAKLRGPTPGILVPPL